MMAGIAVVAGVMVGIEPVHISENGEGLERAQERAGKDFFSVGRVARTNHSQVGEAAMKRAGRRSAGIGEDQYQQPYALGNVDFGACGVGSGIIALVGEETAALLTE